MLWASLPVGDRDEARTPGWEPIIEVETHVGEHMVSFKPA
jgi:hypothetical protein